MGVDYSKLGKRMREVRLKKGYTQEKIAELTNKTQKHISNIENNSSRVSLDTLLEIANVLDSTLDYLLRDSLDNCVSAYEDEVHKILSVCNDAEKERMVKYLRAITEVDETID